MSCAAMVSPSRPKNCAVLATGPRSTTKLSKSSWSCSPSASRCEGRLARSSSAAAPRPSRTVGRDLAVGRLDELHDRAEPAADLSPERVARGRVEQVRLVEDDEVGAGELVGEDLIERVVVVDRRVRRPLRLERRRVVGKAPVGHRLGVDHDDDAIDRDAALDLGPVEGLDERLRQRQARGLDDDVLGRLGTVEEGLQGRQEIVGDGAADAAVCKLDHIVLAAALDCRSRAAARGRCRARRTR